LLSLPLRRDEDDVGEEKDTNDFGGQQQDPRMGGMGGMGGMPGMGGMGGMGGMPGMGGMGGMGGPGGMGGMDMEAMMKQMGMSGGMGGMGGDEDEVEGGDSDDEGLPDLETAPASMNRSHFNSSAIGETLICTCAH
jgi:hypothetical protein